MLVWYVGIADCHGIESFVSVHGEILGQFLEQDDPGKSMKVDVELQKLVGPLVIRANANCHRLAVVYSVHLLEKNAKKTERLISSDVLSALVFMKKAAVAISLAGTGDIKRFWQMIPDHNLDPYY